MRISKAEADAIISLAEDDGVPTGRLIGAARDSKHPCHNRFTWDVHEAAEKCWHAEARALIRACKFPVIYKEITYPVCQFVSSPKQDARTFISLPTIRSKADTKAVLLTEVNMLLGNAARAYGIALAKRSIVGMDVVNQIGAVRDQIAAIKTGLES